MFDALAEWMGYPAYYTGYGGAPLPRSGAAHAAIAPYGPYTAGDGKVVYLGLQNEREWARFCADVLGQPSLASDPRFSANADRVAHRAALDALITAAFATHTAEEVLARLDAAQIANARMNTVEEFLDHPQLAARNRWRTVESPAGPIRALVPPFGLDDVEPRMGPIPAVGEHTDAILNELGYDAATVASWRAADHVDGRSTTKNTTATNTDDGFLRAFVTSDRIRLFYDADQPPSMGRTDPVMSARLGPAQEHNQRRDVIGGDEAAGRLLSGEEPALGRLSRDAFGRDDAIERVLVYRRLARSRADRVARDAVRDGLERHRARQPDQRRLAGHVADAIGRPAQAVDRRDVDDAAPAVLLHPRHGEPDGVERRRQIHRHPFVPFLDADVFDGTQVTHDGVVDQDVHRAERIRGS